MDWAVGAGEHPTTRLCMQWLRNSVGTKDWVLDYGTGSGVLALGAIKFGAAHAHGTMFDVGSRPSLGAD